MTDIKDTAAPESAMPETAEAATPLSFDMRVSAIPRKDNLVGFAKVTFAKSFVVEGFKVCTGERGIYLNMPSAQGSDGQWRDTAFPVTADLRARLNEAAEAGYTAEIAKMEATLAAARGTEQPAVAKEDATHEVKAQENKPSALEALKNGKEQAKTTPLKAASGKEDKSL
jgi:stage V sporulation protein G